MLIQFSFESISDKGTYETWLHTKIRLCYCKLCSFTPIDENVRSIQYGCSGEIFRRCIVLAPVYLKSLFSLIFELTDFYGLQNKIDSGYI